jgi:Putative adhesin
MCDQYRRRRRPGPRREKRYTVGPDATLTLETFDGSVKVQSWDRAEVLVEIEKRGPDREMAAAIEVTATQDGNRIEVRAHEPKGPREFVGIGNVQSASVSFNVSVPRSLTLTAQTGDGSINLENLSGVINLRSGDGGIRATSLTGDITARTEDGSIFLEGALAGLRAETGDGSVVVEAEDGSAMKSDWHISTGDGSVVFRVPDAFDADIDAASGDGGVRSELTGLRHERADNGRESVTGRLGSGGHRVTIRSGDGSIRVVNR